MHLFSVKFLLLRSPVNYQILFPWWAVDNSDVLPTESAVQLLEEAVRISTECGCPALAKRLRGNLEYRNVNEG